MRLSPSCLGNHGYASFGRGYYMPCIGANLFSSFFFSEKVFSSAVILLNLIVSSPISSKFAEL